MSRIKDKQSSTNIHDLHAVDNMLTKVDVKIENLFASLFFPWHGVFLKEKYEMPCCSTVR